MRLNIRQRFSQQEICMKFYNAAFDIIIFKPICFSNLIIKYSCCKEILLERLNAFRSGNQSQKFSNSIIPVLSVIWLETGSPSINSQKCQSRDDPKLPRENAQSSRTAPVQEKTGSAELQRGVCAQPKYLICQSITNAKYQPVFNKKYLRILCL